jgi:hypothetical protein
VFSHVAASWCELGRKVDSLNQALKEWAVTVQALLRGETILLLRKGGIHDKRNAFVLQSRQCLLFPTYEHQAIHLLKPLFRENFMAQADDSSPGFIQFDGWADITHAIPIVESSAIAALFPYHIWNEQFIRARLAWQPQRPLLALLLRTHRLTQPVSLLDHADYGGCRSWITLKDKVPVAGSRPVLGDDAYHQKIQSILAVLPHESDGGVSAASPF